MVILLAELCKNVISYSYLLSRIPTSCILAINMQNIQRAYLLNFNEICQPKYEATWAVSLYVLRHGRQYRPLNAHKTHVWRIKIFYKLAYNAKVSTGGQIE